MIIVLTWNAIDQQYRNCMKVQSTDEQHCSELKECECQILVQNILFMLRERRDA